MSRLTDRIRYANLEDWLVVSFFGLGALLVATMVGAYRASLPEHQTVQAPDGKPAWLVTCSTPGDCVTETAKACPGGYVALGRDEERGSVTMITNVGTGSGSSIGIPITSPTYSGALTIRCAAAAVSR